MTVTDNYTRVCTVFDSSNVREVAYDTKRHSLRVTFVDGRIYRFENLMPIDFAYLVAAESVGKAFNANVKNKFAGVQIR